MRLKKKDVREAKNKLEQYQALFKKGLQDPGAIPSKRRPPLRSSITKAPSSAGCEAAIRVQEENHRVQLQGRTGPEENRAGLATLKAQMSKAAADYDAAKATADIEQTSSRSSSNRKTRRSSRAGQDGIVAYSNDRYWDASSQVREGATVYSRQKIFSLPDMTHMQLKVNIHESLIKKIKPGQKAEVRIDAFPNVVFVGVVKSVSQLADSTRPWMSGGVKEYTTVVNLERHHGHRS